MDPESRQGKVGVIRSEPARLEVTQDLSARLHLEGVTESGWLVC